MAIIENIELDSMDSEPVSNIQEATPEVASEPAVSSVPEKYKGKSLEDIVHMHQEAEKLIGRQAQEVGEVRKLADELLKQQLAKNKEEPAQEINEIDFFENPKEAVKKAVQEHPDVVAARKAATEFKQMQTKSVLQQKHPDFADIVQDGEFINWVKSSPYRLDLFAKADSTFDLGAADELLSTFKQIRTTKTQQSKQEGQTALKQNLKAATVDTGGTGEASRKVYRRADLIRLRMTDPSRYEALSDEIMKAYSEGRVK